MRSGTGECGVGVGGAGLGGPFDRGGEREHGVQMGGGVLLTGTPGRVQPFQGVGTGSGVLPGAQFGVGELFQGLRQQGFGPPGAYDGEGAGPCPAGRVDLAEHQGRGARPQEPARVLGTVGGVEAAPQEGVAPVGVPGEHGAHSGAVLRHGPVRRRDGDAVHGVQIRDGVPHVPRRLGGAEQGVQGAARVVRGEQFRRGQERLAGVGHGPVAQGEHPAYERRGARGEVGADAGQHGAGPAGVAGQPGLLGCGGEPCGAQGVVGGERGGTGQRGRPFAVGARGGGRGLQPAGECGVRPGRGAGPLDERGQRGRPGPGEQSGEQIVHGPAAAGRRPVQDRAAQQRVAEVHAAAGALQGSGGARGGEEHPVEVGRGQPGPGAGPQQQGRVGAGPVRLVLLRGRGQQEQGAGVGRQPVQMFGVGVEDALGPGQRIRERGAPGQLAGGEAAGQARQQSGVRRPPHAGVRCVRRGRRRPCPR